MTQMRIITPENGPSCPMIIEHDEFLENDNITLNLRFGTYELDYGFIDECDCGSGCKVGLPHLTVKRDNKLIFSENFNHNWALFINIIKRYSKYSIEIRIYNCDDGDSCEICANNRFNFHVDSMVDTYTYCFYSPPKGEFKKHLPVEAEELSEKIKEELK